MTGNPWISGKPPAFHVMIKPTGAACNLSCDYCFYIDKKSLYPDGTFRMGDEVLESCIRQLIEAHRVQRVTLSWQGGEPTLMGLDFYKRAIALQNKYRKPGMTFENTLQTNGVLLDDAWCAFLKENDFLVGLSLDGPGELHDIYRKDKIGRGTFEKVMAGLRLLHNYQIDHNILCTVNRSNAFHPLEIYRFFKDSIRVQYIQFIPVVEKAQASGLQDSSGVTEQSVLPGEWGEFLNKIFDEWVRRDVGQTFVLNFDGTLAGWLGRAGTFCIFGRTCGLGLALEHNGDLYSCDHFVDPEHKLGNILETPLIDMVASEPQRSFGQDKWDRLPAYCHQCDFLYICNGECPKNRFCIAPDGKPGLNYLCSGYRAFFKHTEPQMKIMASLLRSDRPAADIMPILAGEERARLKALSQAGRNEICPCGSGLKFKKCHGK